MRSSVFDRQRSLPALIVGDVVALLLFVVAGLANHRMNSNWLFNLLRISAPFLIGWFAVAPFTGAYTLPAKGAARAFLRRSALNWLLGVGLGLALRATLFREGFVPTFAAVTTIVTGLFVMGWRGLFVWLVRR